MYTKKNKPSHFRIVLFYVSPNGLVQSCFIMETLCFLFTQIEVGNGALGEVIHHSRIPGWWGCRKASGSTWIRKCIANLEKKEKKKANLVFAHFYYLAILLPSHGFPVCPSVSPVLGLHRIDWLQLTFDRLWKHTSNTIYTHHARTKEVKSNQSFLPFVPISSSCSRGGVSHHLVTSLQKWWDAHLRCIVPFLFLSFVCFSMYFWGGEFSFVFFLLFFLPT